MEKMINLRHLLMHEVQDLTSAEEQIIDALPAMIKKANNATLKKNLEDHLKVTEMQLKRLDEVKQLMENEQQGEEQEEEQSGGGKGLFSRLFGGNSGGHKCKGMEGLITEGEKVMGEDMSPEVLDAAIIACAQKIEHYEICGYGTARAYARELNLGEVAELLEETLNEEYEADDLLTDLAVGKVNQKAETSTGSSRGSSRGRSNGGSRKSSNGRGSSNGSARAAAKSASRSKSSSNGRSRSSSGGSKSSSGGSKSSSRSDGSARSKSAAKSKTGTRTNTSSARGGSKKKSSSRSRSK